MRFKGGLRMLGDELCCSFYCVRSCFYRTLHIRGCYLCSCKNMWGSGLGSF